MTREEMLTMIMSARKKVDAKRYKTSYGLKVSLPEGKMQDMAVITTSCLNNEFCKAMHKCIGTICEKCYANASLQLKKGAANCYSVNTEILTGRVLSPEEIAEAVYLIGITGYDYLRFESHGELNNIQDGGVNQVVNYWNIANWCNLINVKCALWTKRAYIIAYAIQTGAIDFKPSNLQIVQSSPELNKPVIPEYTFIDKVFTVYDFSTVTGQAITVNCGAISCRRCTRCYNPNYGKTEVVYINEILKSQSEKLVKWERKQLVAILIEQLAYDPEKAIIDLETKTDEEIINLYINLS